MKVGPGNEANENIPSDILLTDSNKDINSKAEVALGNVCSFDGCTQLRNVAFTRREGGREGEQWHGVEVSSQLYILGGRREGGKGGRREGGSKEGGRERRKEGGKGGGREGGKGG
jgi:hypothetical protein